MQGSWAVLFRIRTLSVPRVLLQSDFNRQKRSLENSSLPLVTLWKRVWTHTQQYTTCVALIYGTQKNKVFFFLGHKTRDGPDSQIFMLADKSEVKTLRLTLPQRNQDNYAFTYKCDDNNDKPTAEPHGSLFNLSVTFRTWLPSQVKGRDT